MILVFNEVIILTTSLRRTETISVFNKVVILGCCRKEYIVYIQLIIPSKHRGSSIATCSSWPNMNPSSRLLIDLLPLKPYHSSYQRSSLLCPNQTPQMLLYHHKRSSDYFVQLAEFQRKFMSSITSASVIIITQPINI